MAIRESEVRSMQIKELEDVLKRHERDLDSKSWLGRLKVNEDWRRLCAVFSEEITGKESAIKSSEEAFWTNALSPDKASTMREQLMLLKTCTNVVKDLMTFPERELERLDKVREEIPQIREQLAELRRKEERVNV